MKNNKKISKWENKFDEEFMVDNDNEWDYLYTKDKIQYPSPEDLKSFISSLLAAQEKKIEEKLSKIEKIRCEKMLRKLMEEIEREMKVYKKEEKNKKDVPLKSKKDKMYMGFWRGGYAQAKTEDIDKIRRLIN